ncbi:GTPase Era [Falseniella ignava]|uniref:GTPase Era n=1 Tax=Falseniella ignava CCUG 37419 TaxID=883112 RepID=K1LR22_9LACT|nr:GTP-binding protein Era [Falseniella ignava CCUG 37419]
MNTNFKSGFISIIGRPNVGKSTLINRFVGQKIAIMSDKPQTTRNRIQGVLTNEEGQIIFIDTPGIHKPKHALGDFMVQTALKSTRGVDGVLVVVNATEPIGPGDRVVLDHVKLLDIPKFLVINKVDLIDQSEIFDIIKTYTDEYEFDEVIPISATEGYNTDILLDKIMSILPTGPQYYPADQVVDHPEYFIVQELIREKVLHLTREEIPHSVAVQVESMHRDVEDQSVEIQAVIIVERKSQKGIIIGSQGKMIRNIRKRAEKDIEVLLGSKAYLEIWVKVQNSWRDRRHFLNEYGYRPDEY